MTDDTTTRPRTAQSLSDLTGQVAVVTGAARGIGKAIGAHLAERGARVVLTDLTSPAASAEEIRASGVPGTVRGVELDVRDPDQVRGVIGEVAGDLGRLDILVSNAGTASRAGLADITLDEWQRDIDTNLRGTFLTCQAAVHPYMIEQGSGRLITISSISGIMGGPTSGGSGGGRSGPAYAASKGGVIALTKWLAKELRGTGITANSVAPGPIATELTASVEYDFSQQLVPRMGYPEEIAAAVTYLASPGADFVTGQVLRVCGGAAIG